MSILDSGDTASKKRERGTQPGIAAEGYAARALPQLLWSSDDPAAAGAHIAQPWFEMLCEQVREALTGFVLLQDATGAYALVASKPIDVADQVYLRNLAEQALTSRKTAVLRPPRSPRPGARVTTTVACPLVSASDCFGVVVLLLSDASPEAEARARQQIEAAAGWFHASRISLLQAQTAATLLRAQMALRALAVVDEHAHLEASAMQLAAHLESHFACDRVSVGLNRSRGRIRVVALSHSGSFDEKSEEARRVQSAMEEAYDQDTTILSPQTEAAPRALALAHRALGVERASVSVILRTTDGKVGAITLERPMTRPFTTEEIATSELIASLVAPALIARRERDEWVTGLAVRKALAFRDDLVGPRRPTLKIATGLIALLALVLAFAMGEYRVPAKAVVEGLVQRAASAPFDGFIASSNIRAGALVKKGDVLATLDDHDLRLERTRWFGEREQHQKQYNDALAKHDRATAGVLAAQIEQADSQLALAEENLSRAQIIAPLDGLVVAGDVSQLVGSPIEKGKILFEVAPLESYRVILNVDERDIAQLQVGQTGELVMNGVVGQKLPFRVRNVTSVTSSDEGKNLFRVEAELLQPRPGIRPGMEGVGKVDAGRHRLAWIWTHRFFDWLRLKLWVLTP